MLRGSGARLTVSRDAPGMRAAKPRSGDPILGDADGVAVAGDCSSRP